MPNVLVIDDLRIFDRLPAAPTYARTSAGALALLASMHEIGIPWDRVYWDHDLGGEDTTIPVLLWLEEMHFLGQPVRIKRCFVHSSNPVGSRTLEVALGRMYPTQRVDSGLYSSSVLG